MTTTKAATPDELMILGLIFAVTTLFFIAVGVIAIVVSRKHIQKISDPKLCTERTDGTVVGGSIITYANHRTARVRYEVDGKTYEISGPLFTSGTAASGMKSNLTTRDNLPNSLKAPILFVTMDVADDVERATMPYERSAIAELYPIGSQADVWYNPSNPAEAYVERYIHTMDPGLLIGGGFIGFGVIWLVCTIAIFSSIP